MRFRLEEDGAAEECSFGDDDNAAAILGCPVDDGLYFLRLQDCTVVCHTVIGNGILLAQCVDVYDFVLYQSGIGVPSGNFSCPDICRLINAVNRNAMIFMVSDKFKIYL